MQLTTRNNPYVTFSFAWIRVGVNVVLDHMPIVGPRRRIRRRMRE